MISLDLAVKLKEAGLKWEPKLTGETDGDWFYWPDGTLDLFEHRHFSVVINFVKKNVTFAPRLDQLLAEIERRGWEWKLAKKEQVYYIGIHPPTEEDRVEWFLGTSPENATARALIWILEREKEAERDA